MWLTISISILTICLITSLLLAMNWMRKDWQSQLADSLAMNRETMRAYESLTRTLLGVPSDSPAQTVTISQPQQNSRSPEPGVLFGDLPLDEDLMREYEEHLAMNGTLSGKPARTNPEVPQIVPGQPNVTA
jgi:hypothetical protein